YRLKQKYGGTVNEIIAYGQQCEEELSNIEFADQKTAELDEKYKKALKLQEEAAEKLSQKRKEAASRLEKLIVSELSFLEMPRVKFIVDFMTQNPVVFNINGKDKVTFLISANPGEPPKSLSKIASGGELSRIMLAIKSIFSGIDLTGTLIFDEIDTGVSGRAAEKIGEKMKKIASAHQVLCVTHLSQIAAIADNHYLITKTAKADNTFTTIMPLDKDGRISEIARMISGADITKTALDAARDMLEKRK
ncbi:MAG: DNA repair protein RecN, partial [Bacillota bacterium]|nr:DNA repair protein RecN [Bacillota bacterium]